MTHLNLTCTKFDLSCTAKQDSDLENTRSEKHKFGEKLITKLRKPFVIVCQKPTEQRAASLIELNFMLGDAVYVGKLFFM